MEAGLTLVLGGARSGKSAYAERLVQSFGRPKIYIATAQAFDDEMRARIDAHRIARGQGWETHEAPLELAACLLSCPSDASVLVDCMTLWLSNQMLAENDPEQALEAVLPALRAPMVLVSNELGLGIVPETRLGRDFRDAHGRMNQKLAAQADRVIFVAAGLPLALKGDLPEGLE